MNLRPQRPEPPDINLAPLIDVVFLLLIFFMVTTTFRDEVGIKIQLPESAGEAAAESQPLILTIDADGTFYVNDRQVSGGMGYAGEDAADTNKTTGTSPTHAVKGRRQAQSGGRTGHRN